jgi:hypothetical protein
LGTPRLSSNAAIAPEEGEVVGGPLYTSHTLMHARRTFPEIDTDAATDVIATIGEGSTVSSTGGGPTELPSRSCPSRAKKRSRRRPAVARSGTV